MQSTISATTLDGKPATAWLHRTGSKKLIVLIHGHNGSGTWSPLITMAKWFEHHGYDCLRWSCMREQTDTNTYIVTTPHEEFQQLTAVIEKIQNNYNSITLVGHSQGGLLAQMLAAQGYGSALVLLMSVFDTQSNARAKLATMHVHVAEDLSEPHAVKMDWGVTFVYTKDFFEDVVTIKPKELLDEWQGPTLFVAGQQDATITVAEVEQGYTWANEPKKLLQVDDAHRFSDFTAKDLAHAIVEWLG